MQDARFGLTGSLAIDMGTGALCDTSGSPAWLIPVDALAAFASANSDAAAMLGELVGVELGKKLSERIALQTDLFVERLAGECALRGYGQVSLERWGDALVIRARDTKLGSAFLAAFFSGVLKGASQRDVRCAALGTTDDVMRFLVCAPEVVPHINERIASGESWQNAIVSLSAGSAS